MKKQIFLIIGIFIAIGVYSQTIPEVIPPSPNAASMGIYAEIPIGYYTGVPNIQIPLYNIQLDGYEFPISVSYHASGIKIEQEASQVGLGWILNAGGTITRNVQGLDDLSGFGYPKTPEINNYSDVINELNTCYNGDYYYYCNFEIDTDPDLFQFNFAGRTGKFFLNKENENDDYPVQLLSPEPLQIQYTPGNKSWLVTDENGIKYHFECYEETDFYSISTSIPHTFSFSDPNNSSMSDVITAWYLTKIELPNEQSISLLYDKNPSRLVCSITRFNYEKENIVEFLRNTFQKDESLGSRLLNVLGRILNFGGFDPGQFLGDVSCSIDPIDNIYQYSGTISDDVVLDSIIFPAGYITFERSIRDDLRHLNYSAPSKINKVHVKNYYGETVREVDFLYDYFNNEEINNPDKWKYLRLRLDSLKISSGSEQVLSYTFDYYTDYLRKFPSKESMAKDYWGYFNGKSGSDSDLSYGIPEIEINEIPSIDYSIFTDDSIVVQQLESVATNDFYAYYEGTDRECKPDYFYTGMLKSITYPTGNKKTFYYEPNSYSNFVPEIELVDFDTTLYACQGSNCVVGGTTSDTINIDSDYPTSVYISGRFFIEGENLEDPEDIGNAEVKILYSSGGSDNIFGSITDGQYNFEATYTVEPGLNKIVLTSQTENIQGELTASWKKAGNNLVYTKQGGGARIKRIHDSDSPEQDRQFYYSANKSYNGQIHNVSTGRLLTDPIGSSWRFKSGFCENTLNQYYASLCLVRSTVPLGTLTSFNNGVPIGYDSVIETNGDSTLVGYTRYEYYNEEETPYIFSVDFVNQLYYKSPYMPNEYKLNNGHLKKISVVDSIGDIQKEVTSIWERDTRYDGTIKGLKFLPGYSFGFYQLNYEWWTKTQETETYYFDGNPVETTHNYSYNPFNYLVSSDTFINNAGQDIIHQYYFPVDYDTTQNFSTLIENHMVGKPIDTRVYNNDQLISGTQTKYNNYGQPTEFWVAEIDDEITDISFDVDSPYTFTRKETLTYNTDKKVNQITPEDGTNIVYLWDVTGSYLMAKVENAIYDNIDQFDGLVCSTDSKVLFSNIKIQSPEAMITTYTYKPLVGAIQQTGSDGRTIYYEYDDFGRLQYTRDMQGNIINKYRYHYAEQ